MDALLDGMLRVIGSLVALQLISSCTNDNKLYTPGLFQG